MNIRLYLDAYYIYKYGLTSLTESEFKIEFYKPEFSNWIVAKDQQHAIQLIKSSKRPRKGEESFYAKYDTRLSKKINNLQDFSDNFIKIYNIIDKLKKDRIHHKLEIIEEN